MREWCVPGKWIPRGSPESAANGRRKKSLIATITIRQDNHVYFMGNGFIFLSLAIALVVVCFIWLLLVLRLEKENRSYSGIIGNLAASLVLLLIQFPEHTPGFWAYGLILVLMAWAVSFVLMILGFFAGRRSPHPWRKALIICGVLSISFNALGGLAFLWEATTSAGGV